MKKLLVLTYTLVTLTTIAYATSTRTIMIDPAGHAKNPGRQLNTNYARSETYRCAEALKKELEKRYHSLRVLLTRAPGETIVPLQNASFANRLDVDLFIHIDFFKQTKEKPSIQPLHFISDPLLDFAKYPHSPHDIIPLHHAHRHSMQQTTCWGKALMQSLRASPDTQTWTISDLVGIPFKPLMGILPPAIAFDIGLTQDNQWNALIQPLVDGIGQLLYTEAGS